MLLHKHVPSNKAASTPHFIQSRGRVGTWARLRDTLYIRGLHKGFIRIPSGYSSSLLEQLERRNKVVSMVRWGLFLLLGALSWASIYWLVKG